MAGDDWGAVVRRYAERLHAAAGGGHHVVSPLGAWLLLAVCAGLAGDDDQRRALAEVLGADADEAAAFASALLAEPHAAVPAGLGVWVRRAVETPRFAEWRAALGHTVDTGDLPSQGEADRWAAERTLGLIERFPLDIDDRTLCLLASALATRVSWLVPFDVVDAAALGARAWGGQLRHVLRAPSTDPRHRQFLHASDRAGTVAVHLAEAHGGLLVGSVIAAHADVAAADVLAVAEEAVTAEARQAATVPRVSLFDLPAGDGPVWSIREDEVAGRRQEHVECVLPAWSAETRLDLAGDPGLGFATAAGIVASALKLPTYFEASQAAVARYGAEGFEAAAVSALAVALSAMVSPRGRRRVATVRFAHPFAVVAAAVDPSGAGPWHGIPVFSAWVSQPSDAEAPGDPPR